MNNIINVIQSKINLDIKYIKNIIELLEDGSTIAFIARYRKDITGNASDETLLKFQEIYEYSQKILKRKEDITNILKEKDNLNDNLLKLIDDATTLRELEDIYEPYKGVKNTRADDAVKNGLENLANIISTMKYTTHEIEQKAKNFLNKQLADVKSRLQESQVNLNNYAKEKGLFKTTDEKSPSLTEQKINQLTRAIGLTCF